MDCYHCGNAAALTVPGWGTGAWHICAGQRATHVHFCETCPRPQMRDRSGRIVDRPVTR